MKAVEIKNGIYWVGGIDWGLRNFHGYHTPRGSTYNAYLIVDEKIVLVDTVKSYLCDEMISRIRSVVDPSKIDYIVSNHVEMDHSGALPVITSIAGKAVVLTSPNGEKGLRKHYGDALNLKVVETGDQVNIGGKTLRFVLTTMVHWPDSMATYIPEERLLLPNDAFGQHIASSERFDDELEAGVVMEEAAKYYANIVLPYGRQVNKALDAVSSLDIDMVAPSHGVIWRSHIEEISAKYRKWANNEVEDRALIVYDTMWGSTEKIAGALYESFEDRGIPVSLADLRITHISDIMTMALESKYIFVGSPTLNNNMMPTVAAFLTYLKGLAPANRTARAFGSYGWGGQSVDHIETILKDCGFDMMEKIKIQYIPDERYLMSIKEHAKEEVGT